MGRHRLNEKIFIPHLVVSCRDQWLFHTDVVKVEHGTKGHSKLQPQLTSPLLQLPGPSRAEVVGIILSLN